MGVLSPDEATSIDKVSYDKKYSDANYFDYGKRPKDIPLEAYLKVYEAFCQAYNIPIVDSDVRQFSYLLSKRIFRYNPDGVDFKPMNKNARLFVTPRGGYVRFHTFSYNGDSEQNSNFMKLADSYLKNLKKVKTLEDKLK